MAKDIYEALLEIQKEGVAGVTFDSSNPHFKNRYISLGKLVEVLRPIFNGKGILATQVPVTIAGEPGLQTVFYHPESDTSFEGVVPLVLEKSNSQGLGSAITYTRRYALLSMLGLVADEDDDGEAASKGGEPEREVANKGSGKKPLF